MTYRHYYYIYDRDWKSDKVFQHIMFETETTWEQTSMSKNNDVVRVVTESKANDESEWELVYLRWQSKD